MGWGITQTEIVGKLLEANQIMADVIDSLFQELMQHVTVEEIDRATMEKIRSAALIIQKATG